MRQVTKRHSKQKQRFRNRDDFFLAILLSSALGHIDLTTHIQFFSIRKMDADINTQITAITQVQESQKHHRKIEFQSNMRCRASRQGVQMKSIDLPDICEIIMNDDDCSKELKAQIDQLRAQLKQQEQLLSGREKWQGDELYSQLRDLQKLRSQRQAQYKKLMRDHYKFTKTNALEKQADSYLQQKLKKMVTNVSHQIDHVLYSRTSKSSISSSSGNSNVEYADWLQQEKEEQHLKQQQRILQEIRQLEKILESMK